MIMDRIQIINMHILTCNYMLSTIWFSGKMLKNAVILKLSSSKEANLPTLTNFRRSHHRIALSGCGEKVYRAVLSDCKGMSEMEEEEEA